LQKNTRKQRRVGLFGGTFNPIHWGHLRPAEEIREQFELSRVIFIPVQVPPHKKSGVVSSAHRFAMVQKAIRGNPSFQVSDIELQRPGKSYSIDTIRHFHGLSGGRDELFFILGTDAFRDIHTWKDYPAFFPACNFIVMTRPGAGRELTLKLLPGAVHREFSRRGNCLVHTSGHRIYGAPVTQLDISSTVIRDCAAGGKSIRYLVPRDVERYIAGHRLYQEPAATRRPLQRRQDGC
jgi:nicotinate-nucleotide adenylyltransferase